MAVTDTPRLGLKKWSAGTDPWGGRTGFNATQQKLDDLTAIDIQGTIAARPAAGVRGRYYWATDQGLLYRDDGAGWVSLGTDATKLAGVVPIGSIPAEVVRKTSVDVLQNKDLTHASNTFPGSLATVAGVNGLLAGKAPTVHTHDAAAIVSGTLAAERLGVGDVTNMYFTGGAGTVTDQMWSYQGRVISFSASVEVDNTIVVPTSGDIANVLIGTLEGGASFFTPRQPLASLVTTNQGRGAFFALTSAGQLYLTSAVGSTNIAAGTAFRIAGTYLGGVM